MDLNIMILSSCTRPYMLYYYCVYFNGFFVWFSTFGIIYGAAVYVLYDFETAQHIFAYCKISVVDTVDMDTRREWRVYLEHPPTYNVFKKF